MMIHLMPNFPSLGRSETSSGFYSGSSGMYARETVLSQRPGREETTLQRHELPPSAQPPHSSFLIDDILGKKEREREERRHKDRGADRERRSDAEDEMNRSTDTDSELDRSRVEYDHIERRCDSDLDRQQERDRERELQCNRFRFSVGRDQVDRDGVVDRHSHIRAIPSSKTLPSPPVSSTTLLSEIPRPTPINPAAIQTGALTTPTIYKPLPTIYDQTALSQAAYMNPHLSACQTSLMRQMCGNFGALGNLPAYSRHEYPAIFDNQYNAFSKSKLSSISFRQRRFLVLPVV